MERCWRLAIVILPFLLAGCFDDTLLGELGSDGSSLTPSLELSSPSAEFNEGETITISVQVNESDSASRKIDQDLKLTWSVIGGEGEFVTSTGSMILNPSSTSSIPINLYAMTDDSLEGTSSYTFRLAFDSAPEIYYDFPIVVRDQSQVAQIEIANLNFGLVTPSTSATRTLNLTNTGNETASSLSGSFNSSVYRFEGGVFPGASGNCGTTLPPANSCTLSLEFAPGATGTYTDTFRLDFFDGSGRSSQGQLTGSSASIAATLSDLPIAFSSDTALNVTVGGTDIVSYRYKLGASLTTNCASSSDYSPTLVSVAAQITEDFSGQPDGDLKLCVLGTTASGDSQPLATPTVYIWEKDTTPPSLSISAPSAPVINALGYTEYTVDFTGASNISLTSGDITLGGDSTGCSVAITGSGTTNRIVTITSCSSADTDLTISVNAGVAVDSAGNTNPASPSSPSTKIDNLAPSISGTWSINPTNGTTSGDFTPQLNASNESTATSGTFEAFPDAGCSLTPYSTTGSLNAIGSGLVGWTMGSSGSDDGTIAVYVILTDQAGNSSGCLDPSLSYTLDTVAPTVSLGPPSQLTIDSSDLVNIPVTFFDENMVSVSLTSSDVVLSGDSDGCAASVSGSGLTDRNVSITGCSNNSGTVSIRIAAGVATDATGKSNTISAFSTSISVTNSTSPTVSQSRGLGVERMHNYGLLGAMGGGLFCAIRQDGSIYCWGTEALPGQDSPPSGNEFVALSASEYGSWCALKTDTSIDCWGVDLDGDVQSTFPTGTGYKFVTVANYVACAIKTDDTLDCWGVDDFETNMPSGTFVDLEALYYAACGVRSDGTLFCWSDVAPSLPTPTGSDFVAVYSGEDDAVCAQRNDGSFTCWNYDDWFLATPNLQTILSSGAPSFSDIVSMSMYSTSGGTEDEICAIRANGEMHCWGNSASETMANLPSSEINVLAMEQEYADVELVGCLLRKTGEILCWGGAELASYTGQPTPTSGFARMDSKSAIEPLATCVSNPTANSYNAIGTGTAADPYIICNADQIKDIYTNSNSFPGTQNSFSLGGDIDMQFTSSYNGLFAAGDSYMGTFNGNGYYVNHFIATNGAFIGSLDFGATVRNLNLRNIDFTNTFEYMGGLAGGLYGGGNITNSSVTGLLRPSEATLPAGGLVGDQGSGTIDQCWSDVIIDGGGIAGHYAKGGLVGRIAELDGGSVLSNSYFEGQIVNIPLANAIGGVLGAIEYVISTATVERNYSTGFIETPGGTNIGGVIGYDSGYLTSGSVTVDAPYNYYNSSTVGSDITNASVDDEQEGLSNAAIQIQTNFSTWNFSTIWSIAAGDSPRLQWTLPSSSGSPSVGGLRVISTNSDTTCAVASNGAVSCWGSDADSIVTSVPSFTDFESITVGYNMACGIRSGGFIECWGSAANANEQARRPIVGDWVDIGLGDNDYYCALHSNGGTACWTESGSRPGTPSPGSSAAMTYRDDYGILLQTDGSLSFGLYAYGTQFYPSMESSVPSGTYQSVSLNYGDAACAVSTSKEITCWDDISGYGYVSTAPTGANFELVAVSFFADNACALQSDGAVNCWGSGTVATDEPTGSDFVTITLGTDNACAIRSNASVECWGGTNSSGQNSVPSGFTAAQP